MNLRQFSMALLISSVPWIASAEAAGIKLDKSDFLSAKKITQNGETVLSVKLSKSGKAKFKKLNANAVNQEVESSIAGVSSHFKLREPIAGDELQMGPYGDEDAAKVVTAINRHK